jgi:uncharacterized protein (TIGR02246 family)
MIRSILTAAAVPAVLFAQPCFAQSATPEGVAEQFAHAWNTHDEAAFGNVFTEDAHFIPIYDVVAEGRAGIAAGIHAAHVEGAWAAGSTLTLSKVVAQPLGSDSAVLHFNVSIRQAGDQPVLERTMLMALVAQPDGWRIAAAQLTKPNCAEEG